MFDLMDEIVPANLRVLDTDIRYIRRRHAMLFDSIQTYWQGSAVVVKSDHILARILSTVVRNQDSVYGQYFSTERQAYSIASSAGMVTNRTVGRVRPKGDFYGCPEIYYFKPKEDSLKKLRYLNEWKTWEPVTVSRHPFSALDYRLPRGNYPKTEEIAVIEIDIPLLYAQYQQWRMDQAFLIEDPVLHPSAFIIQYPLMNMLKSHIDLAFLNRIRNTLLDLPSDNTLFESFISGHPTPYTLVDSVVTSYCDKLKRTNIRFKDLINTLPTPFSQTAGYLYKPSDIPESRANALTEVMIALPLYHLLFLISNASGSEAQNLKWENDFRRVMTILDSGNYFNTIANFNGQQLKENIANRILPLFQREY